MFKLLIDVFEAVTIFWLFDLANIVANFVDEVFGNAYDEIGIFAEDFAIAFDAPGFARKKDAKFFGSITINRDFVILVRAPDRALGVVIGYDFALLLESRDSGSVIIFSLVKVELTQEKINTLLDSVALGVDATTHDGVFGGFVDEFAGFITRWSNKWNLLMNGVMEIFDRNNLFEIRMIPEQLAPAPNVVPLMMRIEYMVFVYFWLTFALLLIFVTHINRLLSKM